MLIIGYDLNRPGQGYQNLIDTIKGLGPWWHHLDSTWLVKSNLTPAQVENILNPHIDQNDRLLVMRVDAPHISGGWLPPDAWAWIKSS